MTDHGFASRQEVLKPRIGWQTKLALTFFLIAIIFALMCGWANAEVITFQSKHANSKCPRPHPDATMSVSIWNSGGWPLWKVYCWYR